MAYHPDNHSDCDVPWPSGWQTVSAHPNSPAGGGGPGQFRQAGTLKKGLSHHPQSPTTRHHVHKSPARRAPAAPIAVPTSPGGFLKAISSFEGNLPHMYLDTKGLVTIGIGFLIENTGTQRITSEAIAWPFIVRSSGKQASAAEIEADFAAVKKLPFGPKVIAGTFKPHTKLDLASTKIDALFDKKVSEFWAQLQAEFGPAFDRYPMAVQYALLDMIFNLGRGGDVHHKGKVVKSTGLHQFKQMRAAIDQKDWKLAGDRSHRNGIGAARNQAIKAWFYGAGPSNSGRLP
jgi:GH24 family phage-related lysozyme (muramidase)